MNTNSLQLSLSNDLDKIGRLDALNGIREALWAINARNILRSVVEEVAGDSADEGDDDLFDASLLSNKKLKSDVENNSISIEVVDGLTIQVDYVYNLRSKGFATSVTKIILETNNKVFTFDEPFALETNVDITVGRSVFTNTFHEFVEVHQELADSTPVGGNEAQIDILIDLLFDFTDIEAVW